MRKRKVKSYVEYLYYEFLNKAVLKYNNLNKIKLDIAKKIISEYLERFDHFFNDLDKKSDYYIDSVSMIPEMAIEIARTKHGLYDNGIPQTMANVSKKFHLPLYRASSIYDKIEECLSTVIFQEIKKYFEVINITEEFKLSKDLYEKLKDAGIVDLNDLLYSSKKKLLQSGKFCDYEIDKIVNLVHSLGLKFADELTSDELKLMKDKNLHKINFDLLIEALKQDDSPKTEITSEQKSQQAESDSSEKTQKSRKTTKKTVIEEVYFVCKNHIENLPYNQIYKNFIMNYFDKCFAEFTKQFNDFSILSFFNMHVVDIEMIRTKLGLYDNGIQPTFKSVAEKYNISLPILTSTISRFKWYLNRFMKIKIDKYISVVTIDQLNLDFILTRELHKSNIFSLCELVNFSKADLLQRVKFVDNSFDRLDKFIHSLGLRFADELTSDELKIEQYAIFDKIHSNGLDAYIKENSCTPYEAFYEDSYVKLECMSIEELELSVRTFNVLKMDGIRTVSDLISLTLDDLRTMRNLGKRSSDEIVYRIHSLGLNFVDELKIEQNENINKTEQNNTQIQEINVPEQNTIVDANSFNELNQEIQSMVYHIKLEYTKKLHKLQEIQSQIQLLQQEEKLLNQEIEELKSILGVENEKNR